VGKPKVCVLRTAGTNCDRETAFAFSLAGAAAELLHINMLSGGQRHLDEFQILAIPGGFTYGDDIAAGKVLANELRCKLSAQLEKFVADGKLIIGICNGFQVLVKAGLLPGSSRQQEASLIINDSGKFEDRWTYLRRTRDEGGGTKCVWTKDLPEIIYLPVAHGEGKFVAPDKKALERLTQNGQVVFQYCDKEGRLAGYPDNPNGSALNIAGICDAAGRILGLMPHPERHIFAQHHPKRSRAKAGDGLQIFKNGVEYALKHL
jgi:phosphoribosylformylglycinamidine synthase